MKKYTYEEINKMYPEKRFSTPQIVGVASVVAILTFGALMGLNRSNKKETRHTLEVHFNNGVIDTISVTSKNTPFLSTDPDTERPIIVFDGRVLCYNVNYFREL